MPAPPYRLSGRGLRAVPVLLLMAILARGRLEAGEFRAGAAAVDITPQHLPIRTAGNLTLTVVSNVHAPLALLANYSTHYASAPVNEISADHFGEFCEQMRAARRGDASAPESVSNLFLQARAAPSGSHRAR